MGGPACSYVARNWMIPDRRYGSTHAFHKDCVDLVACEVSGTSLQQHKLLHAPLIPDLENAEVDSTRHHPAGVVGAIPNYLA